METIHLEIRGRVQGVGFRWYVREKARELRLIGWVRNKPDGNVEVLAAGEREALARLSKAIGEGPPGARVEEVRELDGAPSHKPASPFEIVR
jgi:acylphosphatase